MDCSGPALNDAVLSELCPTVHSFERTRVGSAGKARIKRDAEPENSQESFRQDVAMATGALRAMPHRLFPEGRPAGPAMKSRSSVRWHCGAVRSRFAGGPARLLHSQSSRHFHVLALAKGSLAPSGHSPACGLPWGNLSDNRVTKSLLLLFSGLCRRVIQRTWGAANGHR